VNSDVTATPHGYAISPHLQTIVDEVGTSLRAVYGDRFAGLVLIGSQARGTAVPGSDIDLLLLLQTCDGIGERFRCSDAIADLSLRHDVVISVVPISVDEYLSGVTPFLLNVRREGIRL
jgi:predicted nucleotidyltransferase